MCFNLGNNLSVTEYVKKRKNTKAQTSEDEITEYGIDYCEGNESDEISVDDTARFRKMTTQIMKFRTTNVAVRKTKVEFPVTKRKFSFINACVSQKLLSVD
jgi:hypothetical protein